MLSAFLSVKCVIEIMNSPRARTAVKWECVTWNIYVKAPVKHNFMKHDIIATLCHSNSWVSTAVLRSEMSK